jgi:hypothetical protein
VILSVVREDLVSLERGAVLDPYLDASGWRWGHLPDKKAFVVSE